MALPVMADPAKQSQSLWSTLKAQPAISSKTTVRFKSELASKLLIDDKFEISIHDELHTVRINQRKVHANGSYTLQGEIETTSEASNVTITIGSEVFFVNILFESANYVIRGRGEAGVFMNANALEKQINFEKVDMMVPPPSLVATPSKPLNSKVLSDSPDSVFNQVSSVDVLYLYTSGTMSAANGDAITRINHMNEVTNQIYRDSGVAIEINAVGYDLVEYPDVNLTQTALHDVTNQSHVAFTNILNRRYELGADMVAFIRPSVDDGSCGFAWVNGSNGTFNDFEKNFYMFSVSVVDCGDHILAHELGHNMGLHHSRRQDSNWYDGVDEKLGATFPYALGHGIDDEFVTIMAYSQAFSWAPKALLFSSPNLDCFGLPCGIDNDSADGADAVTALNAVGSELANIYTDTRNLMTTTEAASLLSDSALLTCIDAELQDKNYQYVAFIETIECTSEGVINTAGLENYTNINWLDLTGNSIADVTNLASMSNLNELFLQNNQISDLVAFLDGTRRTYNNFWLFGFQNNIKCWQVDHLPRLNTIGRFIEPWSCDASDDDNDFDNDGISNLDEIASNTNPTLADTDGDGMDDGYEYQNSLDANDASDSNLDADNDGLTNLEEFNLGTSPILSDTDGDGVDDKWDNSPLDSQAGIPQYFDVNRNGSEDIIRLSETNSVTVFDSQTTQMVSTLQLPSWLPIVSNLAEIPSSNANGVWDLTIFGKTQTDNPTWLVFDGLTNQRLHTHSYPNWLKVSDQLAMVTIPDIDNSLSAEIVVLLEQDTGQSVIAFFDIKSFTMLAFKVLPAWFEATSIINTSTQIGGGIQPVIVTGKTTGGRDIWLAYDSVSQNLIQTGIYPNWLSPLITRASGDLNGDSVHSISTLATSSAGANVFFIQDSITGATQNIFSFPGWLSPLNFSAISDTSGDNIDDLFVLFRTVSGNYLGRRIDFSSGTTQFQISIPGWFQPNSVHSIADLNANGTPDILIKGVNPIGQPVAIRWDGTNGQPLGAFPLQ